MPVDVEHIVEFLDDDHELDHVDDGLLNGGKKFLSRTLKSPLQAAEKHLGEWDRRSPPVLILPQGRGGYVASTARSASARASAAASASRLIAAASPAASSASARRLSASRWASAARRAAISARSARR